MKLRDRLLAQAESEHWTEALLNIIASAFTPEELESELRAPCECCSDTETTGNMAVD